MLIQETADIYHIDCLVLSPEKSRQCANFTILFSRLQKKMVKIANIRSIIVF